MQAKPRRVLVVGAGGLIGSAVVRRLRREGIAVTGAGRGRPPAALPVDRWIAIDMAAVSGPADWREPLAGVDAVVNCAGALQDGARDKVAAVHVSGPRTLFEACVQAGVRRVIHFSAMGVDRATPTAFSASKRAGDEALAALDLDWVILRPSVVLGEPAYGGSALVRGLASLPVLPLPPGSGAVQVVQLEDVAETVARLLAPGAPPRLALELAGPEPLAFEAIVARYRAWLGWRPAAVLRLPRWLGALFYGLGDLAGLLGWRPPIRSTAGREILRGAVADPAPWTAATGIHPRSLDEALADRPATVQERWFAGLYLLKGLIFPLFSAFWIATGVISLTAGYATGHASLAAGGMGALSGPAVVGGALGDMLVGVLIAWRRTTRLGLWGGIALSAFYGITGSLLLPGLWADPLGPLLKIFPIVSLNLVCLAILDER